MKVSYYPGCSLHATGKEYDQSMKSVSHALGIELKEVDDWSCCGASSAHSTNFDLSIALSARNLISAEKERSGCNGSLCRLLQSFQNGRTSFKGR